MGMISLSAAAHTTGYSTDTIRRWVKAGKVEAVKGPTRNSPWKVNAESLNRMLADGAVEARTGIAAIVSAQPVAEAVQHWRATVEEWNDNDAADRLTDLQRRDALLAIEGLGTSGLIAELRRFADQLR